MLELTILLKYIETSVILRSELDHEFVTIRKNNSVYSLPSLNQLVYVQRVMFIISIHEM